MKYPRIIRRSDILTQLNVSRSWLYDNMERGLWPAPIQLGARSVGWPEDEVEQVMAAMYTGQSKSEIEQLVTKLKSTRCNRYSHFKIPESSEPKVPLQEA